MLKKIFEEPMVYVLWQVDDGYLLTVRTYRGVAGDREYNVFLSPEEGRSLQFDPEALFRKYDAIATNPELFRSQFVDALKYK